MVYFQLPSGTALAIFLSQQQALPFTYAPLHASGKDTSVKGYDNDFQKVQVGKGQSDFEHAQNALRAWQMFPAAWTIILPKNAPLQTGQTVAMFARAFGLWWRNACRIVFVIDEPTRFGFAYGTLPGHIEMGEELFLVEIDAGGKVWYTIRAFSRPHFLIAKMTYPIMRYFQAKFRRDSAKDMIRAIQTKKHEMAQ